MAEFYSDGLVKVNAELSNGDIVECETMLKAVGDYKEWWFTPPCEYMYGWRESEQDIDNDTIEALYPDEFKVNNIDNNTNETIVKIIKLLEPIEWEVQNNSCEF